MNQRLERLDYLHPLIQRPAHELIKRCHAQTGRLLLVVSGFRSVDEQMLIYQKGRTLNPETGVWEQNSPTGIGLVTKAKPGTSAHNIVRVVTNAPASMALDVIPFRDDGTPDWKPGQPFWDELYDIAFKVGLDPLGEPLGSYLEGDMGHFEEPAWKLKLEALGCMFPLLNGSEA